MPEAPNFLALDSQLCFALYAATHSMNRLYRKVLSEFGITYPQYLVLLVLWEHDRVKVTEIGDRLFLDTATLTPLLKRLEARGLVERSRSKEDERQVIVSLTSEGNNMKRGAVRIPQCVGQALSCTLQDAEQLRDRLHDLRKSIDQTQ